MLKKNRTGNVIVISSPSGAGKTTVAKKLLSSLDNIYLSISLTTRMPRLTEINKVDYYFVSKNLFKKKIKTNSFLEYAKVFDNYYGTLKSEVVSKIKNGQDVLLDIDWQGARQIKKILPKQTLTIFILPPSLKELKLRLKNRKHDNFFVKKRMSKAKKEIMHWKEYDFVVVNDNINTCVRQIKNLIKLSKLKPNNLIIEKF